MVLVNNKGDYLKQYTVIQGDMFSLAEPTLKITRITEKEFATELPNTPIVFDLLEMLHHTYPTEEWRAEE